LYKPTADDSLRDALVKRFEHGLQLGYVSSFLPPKTYALYGLPKPGLWRLHPIAQAPFIFARETIRKSVPAVDDWLDARARRETQQWVRSRLGPRRAEYRAVEQFAR
jgi:hypothetical protein